MQKTRGNRRLTLAEVCVAAGVASMLAGQLALAALRATCASDSRRATAGAAVQSGLTRDGAATTLEVVGQLKDSGLLPQDYSPLDPWGTRYVIVLRGGREMPLEAGRDAQWRAADRCADAHKGS